MGLGEWTTTLAIPSGVCDAQHRRTEPAYRATPVKGPDNRPAATERTGRSCTERV